MHSSGASRREIAKPYLMSMSTPHSQPSSPATGSAEWPPDDRLRRAIHYSETSMMESRGRSVLDTPFAGYDDSFWSSAAPKSVTSLRVRPSAGPMINSATKQSILSSRQAWIASRSLSSGAHSRDPVARNDDLAVRKLYQRFARASSGLRLRTETPGVLRSGFPSPALPATKSPVRRRPAPSPARDPRPMFPV